MALLAGFLLLTSVATAEDATLWKSLHFRDLEILNTSGTLVLQHVRADTARMDQAGQSLLADKVTMEILLPESGEKISVTAPISRYYIGGAEAPARNAPAKIPTHAEVRQWIRGLSGDAEGPAIANPTRGDLLLSDPEEQFRVRFGFDIRGQLSTSHLLWSERQKQFISLGEFEQKALANSDRINITGDAFATDRNFAEWVYYVLGDEPVSVEFESDRK